MAKPVRPCWYLLEPGKMELRDVPMSEPGPGDVIVEVKVANTCGTDLKAYLRGHKKIPMPGPFGHEYAGVVAAVGEGVTRWKPGDRIMGVHTGPCNRCSWCARGQHNLCPRLFDHVIFGTYGSYYRLHDVIHSQNAYPIPEEVPYERAGFLEPLACVIHGLDAVRIEKGDRVVIIGPGVIGLLHLLLAREYGAAEVAVLGRRANRLALAAELGASMALEVPADATPGEIISTLGFDDGADVVIECAGKAETWQQALALARPGGRVSLYSGLPGGTMVPIDSNKLHYSEVSVVSPFHFTPRAVRAAYERLIRPGLPVERLLTDRWSIERLPEAFDSLLSGEGLKYAMLPAGEAD